MATKRNSQRGERSIRALPGEGEMQQPESNGQRLDREEEGVDGEEPKGTSKGKKVSKVILLYYPVRKSLLSKQMRVLIGAFELQGPRYVLAGVMKRSRMCDCALCPCANFLHPVSCLTPLYGRKRDGVVAGAYGGPARGTRSLLMTTLRDIGQLVGLIGSADLY